METGSFSWDASTVPWEKRFDAFIEGVCRAFAHLEPVLLDRGAAFHARIEHRETETVSVTHLAGSNYISRRTPAGIARSHSEDFFLNYVVSGAIHVRQGDGRRDVSSGGIFVLDNTRPFELAMRPGGVFQSTVVRMGRPPWLAVCGYDLLEVEAVLRRHPLLPLLQMNLAMLSQGSSLAQAGKVAFFGHTTVRLVELMLSDSPEDIFAQGPLALQDLVCLEIDRNLWDLDFSLEQLAARLKLPPRRVQRILADRQLTFSSYLRERRLATAVARLKDRTAGHSIEAVAAESGFRDLSTFYRSFKRQYGINPGELRKV